MSNIKNSWSKSQALESENNTKQRLDNAYQILEGEVHLPPRLSKSYIRFFKKIGKNKNDCPTSIKLLQFKLDLDQHLDGLTELIYRKLKLH